MTMGASAKEFLDVRMSRGLYDNLPNDLTSQMEVNLVRVTGEDFSHDELWCDLKKKSDKAYKDLKNREYDLRHNLNK